MAGDSFDDDDDPDEVTILFESHYRYCVAFTAQE